MIQSHEVDYIEDLGVLSGKPVKLIRTIGGLCIAAGIEPGKEREEALSTGSHPAIVRYSMEKRFGSRFQPAMYKSEGMGEPVVRDHSKAIKGDLYKKGYSLHSVRNGNSIELHLSKSGTPVFVHTAMAKGEEICMEPEARYINFTASKEAISGGVVRSLTNALYDIANQDGEKKLTFVSKSHIPSKEG